MGRKWGSGSRRLAWIPGLVQAADLGLEPRPALSWLPVVLASRRLHAEPPPPGPGLLHAHKLGVPGSPSESLRGLLLNTLESSFSSKILDGDEQGQVTQVFGSLARQMEFPETLQ